MISNVLYFAYTLHFARNSLSVTAPVNSKSEKNKV